MWARLPSPQTTVLVCFLCTMLEKAPAVQRNPAGTVWDCCVSCFILTWCRAVCPAWDLCCLSSCALCLRKPLLCRGILQGLLWTLPFLFNFDLVSCCLPCGVSCGCPPVTLLHLQLGSLIAWHSPFAYVCMSVCIMLCFSACACAGQLGASCSNSSSWCGAHTVVRRLALGSV
jgi:hypothetical protein